MNGDGKSLEGGRKEKKTIRLSRDQIGPSGCCQPMALCESCEVHPKFQKKGKLEWVVAILSTFNFLRTRSNTE